ncbi:hypothetical protein EHW99_1881 [Erwinia amylovora]|uniref:Uncharacterized protein n=3 Tax=Erwinia amylovora TaxID=552 RepID=A0A831ESC8_ERWAM|nr:hypothetical protein EaACW_1708 [Erwinia amylovora ACW56400]QJQ54585.1 hypothetical protein EHX00_1881 [Erwinia amylovora]CBA20653.1 hypothetical protein predicted by Glimmer/Critica [Erwinia amylovora CFBP1430]CBX80574.1 hypothetical protein predicted by Glimmer/Critica [Erwinia amylovora ATCC BAA-2158]CCO78556.1 hypothetical protein BN432_1758 [Erwinia amylovora Ea356]CCO82351.1 hypothetical protein BN433_1781 [Erwinia amylovora Ea266]CCO86137.1 hypothetical protein BN434_1749 [Erwinia a
MIHCVSLANLSDDFYRLIVFNFILSYKGYRIVIESTFR